MAQRRKTKAQRDQERYEKEQRAWDLFRPQLETIGSVADAKKVLAGMPPPDSPGRKYYTNLGWFVDTFSPPGNSSAEEKGLYIEIIRKMDEQGELKEGAREQIEMGLRKAIAERPW